MATPISNWMSLPRRVRVLISRSWRARTLGTYFGRAATFRNVPKSLRIAGRHVPVEAPNEGGIRTAFVDVLLDDCYGLRRLSGVKCRTILDVGANTGLFTLAAYDVFPQAIIHCYEPNPTIGKYLKLNAAQVGATYYGEAVGRHAGQVSLISHDDSVQTRTQMSESGTLPQVAFAKALERIGGHCDLIKMDCEGAEWEILADRDSWQHVDRLTMEYHLWASAYTHDDVFQILDSLGFDVIRQFADHPEYGRVWASRKRVGN